MKHLAAYLLLSLGGNAHPSEKDIKKVFSVVDATVDEERLKALLKELQGKDVESIIAEGNKKLASVPSGGGAAAPAAAAAAAPAAAKDSGKKKEEEKKEEEEDGDMGFSLFD